jgi:hypothetical protein
MSTNLYMVIAVTLSINLLYSATSYAADAVDFTEREVMVGMLRAGAVSELIVDDVLGLVEGIPTDRRGEFVPHIIKALGTITPKYQHDMIAFFTQHLKIFKDLDYLNDKLPTVTADNGWVFSHLLKVEKPRMDALATIEADTFLSNQLLRLTQLEGVTAYTRYKIAEIVWDFYDGKKSVEVWRSRGGAANPDYFLVEFITDALQIAEWANSENRAEMLINIMTVLMGVTPECRQKMVAYFSQHPEELGTEEIFKAASKRVATQHIVEILAQNDKVKAASQRATSGSSSADPDVATS